MTIRFTKPRHEERPPTMTVIRDDGTAVGQASTDFFIGHDLTHYAVETTFGFRQAFYGLLHEGMTLESFTERKPGSPKAPVLPQEAYLVEFIVGALDAQRFSEDMSDSYVVARILEMCDSSGIGAPEGLGELLAIAVQRRDELIGRYSELAAGETLEIEF